MTGSRQSITAKRLAATMAAIVLSLLSPVTVSAQDEPEYKMEVGAGLAMNAYTGDFNANLFKGMNPWYALGAKYRLSPRTAIAFGLGMGKIKGSTDNVDTWYPIDRYEFDNTLTEGMLRMEWNFWAYGTGREYRGARRLAPFITVGLGLTHYSGEESGLTPALLIGGGLKYKVAPRLNIIAEWAVRVTTSDKLDGRADPSGIKSSGLFKNTDCYSMLQLSLTYDIWMKCKTCHNDRD